MVLNPHCLFDEYTKLLKASMMNPAIAEAEEQLRYHKSQLGDDITKHYEELKRLMRKVRVNVSDEAVRQNLLHSLPVQLFRDVQFVGEDGSVDEILKCCQTRSPKYGQYQAREEKLVHNKFRDMSLEDNSWRYRSPRYENRSPRHQ